MFLMLPNLKIDLKTTWKWWKIQEVAFQTNEREKWNRESGDDGRLLTFWDILEMAYLTITKRLYHSNVQQIWRFEGHQVHPHFCPYWWYFSFIFQVLICKCVSRRSHSSTRVLKNYQSYLHLPSPHMKSAILTFSIYKLCSDYNTFAESWSMIIMNFDDELKR